MSCSSAPRSRRSGRRTSLCVTGSVCHGLQQVPVDGPAVVRVELRPCCGPGAIQAGSAPRPRAGRASRWRGCRPWPTERSPRNARVTSSVHGLGGAWASSDRRAIVARDSGTPSSADAVAARRASVGSSASGAVTGTATSSSRSTSPGPSDLVRRASPATRAGQPGLHPPPASSMSHATVRPASRHTPGYVPPGWPGPGRRRPGPGPRASGARVRRPLGRCSSTRTACRKSPALASALVRQPRRPIPGSPPP